MKNFCLALFLFLMWTGSAIAQVPQGIPYQAIARDTQGQPLAGRAVQLRFSILDSVLTGSSVYIETHSTNTNASGLLAVNIGMGTPITGTFSGINWGVNSKFLRVELDTTATGGNYVDLGTQQMMSVPYALYAGNIPFGGGHGQTLTICDGIPIWTSGGDCPAYVASLSCGNTVNNGALAGGIPASGVTTVVSYVGGNGGSYPSRTCNSTGVAGLSATLTAGTLAHGPGTLIFSITGTPLSSGTASFTIYIGGQSCVISMAVAQGSWMGINNATCGAPNVLNSTKVYRSISDYDGNSYKTIFIGSQEWMAENLKVSHYRNGDPIPVVTDDSVWSSLTTGAACWYNNDSAAYNCPYGKLYNWYTVNDARNLCPSGWHVPSMNEWNILSDYLGGYLVSGGKMKTIGTQYWLTPNESADNSSGFSGPSAGNRRSEGNFDLIGIRGYYWSTDVYFLPNHANFSCLGYEGADLGRNANPMAGGFSVRCIKD